MTHDASARRRRNRYSGARPGGTID